MFTGRWLLAVFVMTTGLLAGCTRPEGESSKIKIVLPAGMMSLKDSSQAVTADQLRRVMINVSGEGIPSTIFVAWENCYDCLVPQIKNAFTLDVPMGSNRFFQVLAVYESNNGMEFYYGDKAQTLSLTSESVIVPIAKVSQTSIGGGIQGRYIDQLTALGPVGPYGIVNIKFNPPNGRPPVIVDKSIIINGWFNFFMLGGGASLSYQMENGRMLFGGPISLDDARFKPASNTSNLLRVTIPPVMRGKSGSNNSVTWDDKPEEAQVLITGWFSDADKAALIANRVVCRPNSLATLTRMSKANQPGTLLTGVLNGALPSNAALVAEDATALGSYYVNGGLDESNAACSDANNLYASFLKFGTGLIDGEGKDGAALFNGPFRKNTTGGKFFAVSTGAANRSLTAQLLPGTSGLFIGYRAFKKVTSAEVKDDNLSCYELGARGFVPAGEGPAADANGNVSISTNITAAEATNGVTAAVCPILNSGVLAPFAVMISKSEFNQNSYNNNPMPADGYSLKLGLQNLVPGVCIPAQIDLSANNQFGNVSNSSTHVFTLSLSGLTPATFGVYDVSDSSCSSDLGPIVQVDSGSVSKRFRIKITSGGTPSGPSFNVTTSSFGTLARSVQFQFTTIAGAATKLFVAEGVGMSIQNQCYPLTVYTVDSNNYPNSFGTSYALSFSFSNPGQIGTFSDPNCATTAASVTIPAGSISGIVYLKRTSGSGENTLTISHSNSLTTAAFVVDPVTYAHHVNLEFDSTLKGLNPFVGPTECLPMKLQAYNSDNSQATSLTNPIPMTIGASGGAQFFASLSDCNGNTNASNPIPVSVATMGGSSPVFFMKKSGGGNFGLVPSWSIRVENPGMNQGLSMNIGPSAPDQTPFSSPYAWFDMNNSSTQFWTQASGNTITNLYSRGPSILTGSLISSGTTPTLSSVGGPWRSVNFNGGFFSKTISGENLNSPAFMIAMRVKFANLPSSEEGLLQIFGASCNGSSGTADCSLVRQANGTLRFLGVSTGLAISDNNFHTIIAYRDSSNQVSLFVDGVAFLANAPSAGTNYNDTFVTTGKVMLGASTINSGSTYSLFYGNMGDVLIYASDQAANRAALEAYLSSKFP